LQTEIRTFFRQNQHLGVGYRPPNTKEYEMNFQSYRKPIGTTARTGEVCPESGVWQAISTPTTTAPIAKGNRMPPYNNVAVTWKLIRYA
jgi:hypothetical protein